MHGNFYMEVIALSTSLSQEDIDVNTLMTNILLSIQTMTGSHGMVIKYTVHLMNTTKMSNILLYNPTWSFENFPPGDTFRCSRFSPYDPYCYSRIPLSQSKSVYIILQNSYFVGSCVIIKDSELSIEHSWFRFEINNIKVSGSTCQAALSVVNSETYNFVRLSDLTIINSHNNILSTNIGSSKLILSSNTSFLSNQGSVLLSNGAIEFRDFTLISDNTAHINMKVYFKLVI